MRSMNPSESRDHILRDLWLRHGSPEKMTIHVRRTGETIFLINGMPAAEKAGSGPLSASQKQGSGVRRPVTLTCTCIACTNEFSARRINARFCSPRCRKRFNREREALLWRMEHERALAAS